MQIAHYNTFADGGSAVVMRRLHERLLGLGHESFIRHRRGNLQLPHALRLEFCQAWIDRQRERFQHRFTSWVLKDNAPSFYGGSSLHKATPPPTEDLKVDIIHLHWISNWLDLRSFLSKIPKNIPIIWTVHDMSPLAGGCYTDFNCDQLGKKCQICPLLKPPFNRFLAAKEWKRRSDALSRRKVIPVGNSTFTSQLIQKAALFKHPKAVSTIYPGLNFQEFTFHNKFEARRLLGLISDRPVLGFGAASLTDKNKGFDRFLKVAELTAQKLGEVDVLVFGDGLSGAGNSNLKVHNLGTLNSPHVLSLAYSAMDILIITSKMESFGQVAIEAQACGTAVFAFDVGGIRETIQDGTTGKLFPFNAAEMMAETIDSVVKNENFCEMGEKGRKWVMERFSIERMTEQYLSLYREAIGS